MTQHSCPGQVYFFCQYGVIQCLFNHTSFVLVLWDLYFFLLSIFQTYIYFCVTLELFSYGLQNLTNYTLFFFCSCLNEMYFLLSHSCSLRICVPMGFETGKLISRSVFCVTFANLPSRCKSKRGVRLCSFNSPFSASDFLKLLHVTVPPTKPSSFLMPI